MTPLVTVDGPALSLPEADIDTDIIYPARFLLITERDGLGRYAFHDRRDEPGFPLAPDATQAPPFLVAGSNFGCGSSREQAPWALAGLGIRVIIAASFGEIFYSNCLKNGMLPIRLDAAYMDAMHGAARAGEAFAADLKTQTLTVASQTLAFAIPADAREALLNGWSEIARIAALHSDAIAAYETRQRTISPWLW